MLMMLEHSPMPMSPMLSVAPVIKKNPEQFSSPVLNAPAMFNIPLTLKPFSLPIVPAVSS